MRSFFTTLGIIIGVVGVVTIVSLGEGVKHQLSGQVADLGTNLISVRPGKFIDRDPSSGKIKSVNLFAGTGSGSLSSSDIDSIKKIDGVQSAVALGNVSGLPAYNGETSSQGVVISAGPDLMKVIDHKIDFGTYFDQDESRSKNAVIGPMLAEKLFKESVPIGKTVTIRGQSFLVQGVFSQFSQPPISTGADLNYAVFISDDMAKQLLGQPAPIYNIMIKKSDGQNTSELINNIDKTLSDNHFSQHDFTVMDQSESGDVSADLVKIMTKMIAVMAGVTLFIGGIGIMNVMLASVSERREEIGIRKAIGATDSQIQNQFVLESAILSVWGAVFGIICSGVLNIILRIFTDLEPILSWQPIVISSGIAILTGIIFGSIPAIKAARKDPIESFRA
jgi:putative ABC transport system permease protein